MTTKARAAGLFRRLAALAYDLLLIVAIVMTTTFVLVQVLGGAVPTGSLAYQIFVLAQLAAFFIAFWAYRGQTLGMQAWGIRVETDAGLTPSLTVAAKRFGYALLSYAPLGLGLLWVLFDADGRAWHDRWSGTRVVRAPHRARATA